jgi:hypothetical protein
MLILIYNHSLLWQIIECFNKRWLFILFQNSLFFFLNLFHLVILLLIDRLHHIIRREHHIRYLSSLPIKQYYLSHTLQVRFTPLQQFTFLLSNLSQKVSAILPTTQLVYPLNMLLLHQSQHWRNISFRV